MTKAPIFSIILVCGGGEELTCACLQSILAQSFPDFEVLLITGGGGGLGANLIEEYLARADEILVIDNLIESPSPAIGCVRRKNSAGYLPDIHTSRTLKELSR